MKRRIAVMLGVVAMVFGIVASASAEPMVRIETLSVSDGFLSVTVDAGVWINEKISDSIVGGADVDCRVPEGESKKAVCEHALESSLNQYEDGEVVDGGVHLFVGAPKYVNVLKRGNGLIDEKSLDSFSLTAEIISYPQNVIGKAHHCFLNLTKLECSFDLKEYERYSENRRLGLMIGLEDSYEGDFTMSRIRYVGSSVSDEMPDETDKVGEVGDAALNMPALTGETKRSFPDVQVGVERNQLQKLDPEVVAKLNAGRDLNNGNFDLPFETEEEEMLGQGGGCTLATTAGVNPMMLLLMGLATLPLVRRRFQ